MAILPCDDHSDTGAVSGTVDAVTERVDVRLSDRLEANTSFVATMVDRITPAARDVGRIPDGSTRAVAGLVEAITDRSRSLGTR